MLCRGWGAKCNNAGVRAWASPAPPHLNMANRAVPEMAASFNKKSRSSRKIMVIGRAEV